jgi:intein-encoded DNA endonuclease-like protein
MRKKLNFSQDTIKSIIESYLFGLSSIVISKRYGVSPQSIRYILKKNDVKIRPSFKRIYKLNEDYFDVINSVDKAYFLGLMYSDGSNTGRGLKITLTEKDVEIIEKFKKCIEYGGNIKTTHLKGGYNTVKKTSILTIFSKKISEDLTKHGCIKNKTHFTTFPKINKAYINHFIRGVFDGDGGVNINKKNQSRIYFTGNNNLIVEINNIISKECNINPSKILPCKKCNGNIVDVFYSGNRKCEKIKKFLYKDCDEFYLNRKKIILDNVKTIRNFK